MIALSHVAECVGTDTARGQLLARKKFTSHVRSVMQALNRRRAYSDFRQCAGMSDGSDMIPNESRNAHVECHRLNGVAEKCLTTVKSRENLILGKLGRCEMFTIAPSTSLGTFFTGTLAFIPKNQRLLFSRGV